MIKDFNNLAKKCVKEEISGIFILKNGIRIRSNKLRPNYLGNFYFIGIPGIYDKSGLYIYPFKTNINSSDYNLINFIPDTVNERNITLTLKKAKEWYNIGGELKEIALQVYKEDELKSHPKSWKEYIELSDGFDGTGISWQHGGYTTTGLHHRGKAIIPTDLTFPFIAYMQLMAIRKEWVGNWKPNFNDQTSKFCIECWKDQIIVEQKICSRKALSFPTKEMAEEFVSCFRDLLEQAKELF